MKRRNGASETSARKVRCAYCDWEDKQKCYKQHCERVHRGKCAKLRGQPTLAESLMMRSKKKKKVANSHKLKLVTYWTVSWWAQFNVLTIPCHRIYVIMKV